jgi:hypothetical protein
MPDHPIHNEPQAEFQSEDDSGANKATAQTNIPEQTLPARAEHPRGKTRLLRLHVPLLWSGVVVGITLLSALAAAYALRPQINITASPSLNKDEPFQPIVTIANNGLTEIHDLRFVCGMFEGRQVDRKINKPTFSLTNKQTDDAGNNIVREPILSPQSSIVRTCAFSRKMPGTHILWVAISFRVQYRPSYWPLKIIKEVRFRSRFNPPGAVQWIPESPDAPLPPLPPAARPDQQ